jgi:hypothetical protein
MRVLVIVGDIIGAGGAFWTPVINCLGSAGLHRENRNAAPEAVSNVDHRLPRSLPELQAGGEDQAAQGDGLRLEFQHPGW